MADVIFTINNHIILFLLYFCKLTNITLIKLCNYGGFSMYCQIFYLKLIVGFIFLQLLVQSTDIRTRSCSNNIRGTENVLCDRIKTEFKSLVIISVSGSPELKIVYLQNVCMQCCREN